MKKNLVLINFGGPRDASEIRKFLTDLFSDPNIFSVPLPEFLRLALARFIAKKRTPKVEHAYAAMGFGGGSPLVAETFRQAEALKKVLDNKTGDSWNIKVAMTCGYPHLDEMQPEKLAPSANNILLPLFPHFSFSTTGSVIWNIEKITGQNPSGKTGWICPFYLHHHYLDATAAVILDYFAGKNMKHFLNPDRTDGVRDWQNVDILFSAHGIPESMVKKGDTYQQEVADNVSRLTTILRKKGFRGRTMLSFQSRVGPVEWIKPYTIDLLKELGQKGQKRIAVYPISFVSDHLETLEEIGMQLKEVAHENGIRDYYRIPAPGTHPAFVRALAEIVMAKK